MKKPKKIKHPFSDLGKDEIDGQDIGIMKTQGKRMTGKDLLKKAMGKLAKKK